jgi:hypothetical protein
MSKTGSQISKYGCYAAMTNMIVLTLIEIIFAMISSRVFAFLAYVNYGKLVSYAIYCLSLAVLCISEGMELFVAFSISHST